MKDMEEIITEHRFFRDMPEDFREVLVGCAKLDVYEPGQFVFKAGDQATHFYLIRTGNVVLELNIPGKEVYPNLAVGGSPSSLNGTSPARA